MPLPIVIAYHLVWTAYGFWLPNDPRGSMSHSIRNDILAELGDLHHGRKEVQPASQNIRDFYERAEPLLKHPLLELDIEQRNCIAEAFTSVIKAFVYTCYACAIMPDHVHIIIRKHKHLAEEMISNLQRESRALLTQRGFRSPDHPTWGGPGWKVFLDEPEDVRRTIGYIEKNPAERGLPRQAWEFVKEYDGWPLHPGHSPNSPYARRLRGRRRADL